MAGLPPENSGSSNIGQSPEQSREENSNANITTSDVDALFNLITPGASFAPNYEGEWQRQNFQTSGSGVVGRIPMVITTEQMAQEGRYIVFWVGPDNVSWNFPMRGSTQKTATGTVQHYYKDRKRNTFWDEPEMNIVFQSGNIMPIRISENTNLPKGTTANTIVQCPFGLQNFYEFMELMDQRKAIADGRTNYVYILYSSLTFPRMILRGFFMPDNGVTFSESASDGAELKWTAMFKVVSTTPRFNSAQSLMASWLELQERLGFRVRQTTAAFIPLSQAPLGVSGDDD